MCTARTQVPEEANRRCPLYNRGSWGHRQLWVPNVSPGKQTLLWDQRALLPLTTSEPKGFDLFILFFWILLWYGAGACVCHAHRCRSEGYFVESAFFFHLYVGYRAWVTIAFPAGPSAHPCSRSSKNSFCLFASPCRPFKNVKALH